MPGNPILIFTLAICLATVSAHSQEMRVEEPEIPAAPPIDPTQDAGSWQVTKTSSALSPAQRAALEERRKQVEAMTQEIRMKREALVNSGQSDKAALAKDLENLILDSGNGAKVLEQLEKVLEKQTAVQEKNMTKKAEQLEKKLQKQLEKAIQKNQDKSDKSNSNNSNSKNKSKNPNSGK